MLSMILALSNTFQHENFEQPKCCSKSAQDRNLKTTEVQNLISGDKSNPLDAQPYEIGTKECMSLQLNFEEYRLIYR